MDEVDLKQLIKGVREKSSVIVFLLGFSLVILIGFNLLVSTSLRKASVGEISQQAASTQIGFDVADNFEDIAQYDAQYDSPNGTLDIYFDNDDKQTSVYFVHEGDSTWKIASELLGDGSRYPEIEKLNGFVHNQRLEIGQIVFVDVDSQKNVLEPDIFELSRNLGRPNQDQTLQYTIEVGDSLWKIAMENYSDPMVWLEIYELNREVIGSNPDLIFPGSEITLPNLDKNL